MKAFINWTPQQEQTLIQLYQEHGKQYTKLCQHLQEIFYLQRDKFNVNRINSKLNSLLREGLTALLEKSQTSSNPQHHEFPQLVQKMSTSRIVLGITSLENEFMRDSKSRLLALKFFMDKSDEDDIDELIGLIRYIINNKSQQVTQLKPKRPAGQSLPQPSQQYIENNNKLSPFNIRSSTGANYNANLTYYTNPSYPYNNLSLNNISSTKPSGVSIVHNFDLIQKDGNSRSLRNQFIKKTDLKQFLKNKTRKNRRCLLEDVLQEKKMSTLRRKIKESLRKILGSDDTQDAS